MSIPNLLKVCAGLYLVVVLVEWRQTRNSKRLWLLLPLIVLVALDVLIASESAGYVTFGAESTPVIGILIMFGAIVLGCAARYIFYLEGRFSWLDFVKPVCISPILLLPLIGSLQSVKSLEPMQLVSFALLAFQNGFFWQAVLQQSQPRSSGGA